MNTKIKKITTIGMLCAMTHVIMAVGRIPVVLFLKYDPADVIVTLDGLILGPMTSCIVSVIVATIEMITVSDTGILGCSLKCIEDCTIYLLLVIQIAYIPWRQHPLSIISPRYHNTITIAFIHTSKS